MTFLRGLILSMAVLLCAPWLKAQSKVETLNLTFTTIDVPGAGQTNVAGVNNNGDMVGWYVPTGSSFGHGFLLSGGNLTTLDYPKGYTTLATGINDSGVVIGYSYITGEDVNGFTYQGGVFNTIQIAGYPDTYAEGVNNAGDIVGGYGFGSANGFEQSGTKFRIVPPQEVRGRYRQTRSTILARSWVPLTTATTRDFCISKANIAPSMFQTPSAIRSL